MSMCQVVSRQPWLLTADDFPYRSVYVYRKEIRGIRVIYEIKQLVNHTHTHTCFLRILITFPPSARTQNPIKVHTKGTSDGRKDALSR